MGDYYQVVHCRVKDGAEDAMLALRPRFVAGMRRAVPGLREARLVRLEDGTWLDIVRWDSRSSAEAAEAAHDNVPEAQEMARHLSEILDFLQGDDAEPLVEAGR